MIDARDDHDPYPGGDDLPDISGTKFDHTGTDGNPVRFLWGVATSSYQVEGGIGSNDWHAFLHSAAVRERIGALGEIGRISFRIEDPGGAVGHWDIDTFRRDVERAKSLGINAYRLSLEWSRIQKSSQGFDSEALSHYLRMIRILVRDGITPVVTLNHFTLPQWVLTPPSTLLGSEDDGFRNSLGGWENPKTVAAFVDYVRFVVGQIGDMVRYWVTINEPTSLIGCGYLGGIWPPGFIAAEDRARKSLFNLIDAHVQAYDVIKGITGDGSMVGIAHAMVYPKSRSDLLGLNSGAAAQYDYSFNRLFLEAVKDGIYNPTLMLGNKDRPVIERWKDRLDFVGLNYYRSVYIYKNEIIALAVPWVGGIFDEDLRATSEPHNILNDLGWEVYPGGLYRLLRYIHERFRIPILITENGLALESDPADGDGEDSMRAPYIVAHLSQVLRAIKDGINVLGYLHWSLVDNWEWDYDYLPKARFGLYTISRDPAPKAVPPPRTKTLGSQALQYVIRKGSIGDAAERFGTITPSGKRIIPPSRARH